MPKFGIPGRIDLLLGVDIFASVVYQGRRYGPPNSPIAFETEFGWVLAGNTGSTDITTNHVVAHQSSLLTTDSDDILKQFWEIDENVSTNIGGEAFEVIFDESFLSSVLMNIL